jgi:hypothetical protein
VTACQINIFYGLMFIMDVSKMFLAKEKEKKLESSEYSLFVAELGGDCELIKTLTRFKSLFEFWGQKSGVSSVLRY